jgi:hypothetical protein
MSRCLALANLSVNLPVRRIFAKPFFEKHLIRNSDIKEISSFLMFLFLIPKILAGHANHFFTAHLLSELKTKRFGRFFVWALV